MGEDRQISGLANDFLQKVMKFHHNFAGEILEKRTHFP